MSSQGNAFRRAGVLVFQHATEHKVSQSFGEYKFHKAEHHHRGQAHKRVRKRRQDDTRRTARTRLALCHRVTLDSVARWWVLARTTHGTPVPPRSEAVGGPRHAPRDTPKRRDQGYHATLWLPTRQRSRFVETADLRQSLPTRLRSDRIVDPLYVFVTSEYCWSANVERTVKAQALRDNSTNANLMSIQRTQP